MKVQCKDGAFVEYMLALALTAIPENSGNLDPVWKYLHVRKSLTAVPVKVLIMGNIVGCMHVIPQIPTSSKSGDGRNKRLIDNGHIDQAT
jgi:hypothetical protein